MAENMISVSQFSNYVKQIFNSEELLHNILIYGEVSDFNVSKGNAYFNLKDEESLLQCLAFSIDDFDFIPKEGDSVVVCGSPNYYTKGGRFSFVVKTIEAYGVGVLYQKFLEMKQKLEKEGLFDQKRKKALPKNIKRIGVVTSETGAVIQDIIDITRRRNPMLDIVLYPAKVQGIGAEETVIEGIKALDETNVDLIIIARGGGSLEDLNTFNTEVVARAIFEAKKMIISAVGHETDFTITDFVADLRAPTPSAAAEIVSVDLAQLKDDFEINLFKLFSSYNEMLDENYFEIVGFNKNLVASFEKMLIKKLHPLKELNTKIAYAFDGKIKDKDKILNVLVSKLEQNNPLAILKRGYASVEKKNKKIKSVDDVCLGDEITLRLVDGVLDAEIKEKRKEK